MCRVVRARATREGDGRGIVGSGRCVSERDCGLDLANVALGNRQIGTQSGGGSRTSDITTARSLEATRNPGERISGLRLMHSKIVIYI